MRLRKMDLKAVGNFLTKHVFIIYAGPSGEGYFKTLFKFI